MFSYKTLQVNEKEKCTIFFTTRRFVALFNGMQEYIFR